MKKMQEGGIVSRETSDAPEDTGHWISRLGSRAMAPVTSAYEAYQQFIGKPFAGVAGPLAAGYLGLDRPGFGSEEAYRTGQAMGNMPGVGAPAGIFKAAAQAPELLKAAEATATAFGTAAGARGLRQAMPAAEEAKRLYTPLPSAEAPFVGRLDEFVSSLPGPVRKDQFLGQITNKFRDYDVGRAKEALASFDDTAKISPSELLNRLQEKYPPSRYRTQVVDPQMNAFYPTMDNPYQGQPMGVIHLLQDPISGVSDRIKNSTDKLKEVQYSLSYLPQEAIKKQYSDASRALKNLPQVTPAQTREFRQLFVPYARANKERAELEEIAHALKFPTLTERYRQDSRNLNFDQRTALQRSIQSRAARQMQQKYGLTGFESVFNADQNLALSELENLAGQVRTRQRSAMNDLREFFGNVRNSYRTLPYRGQHSSLKGGPDPIAFSRFTEHAADVPGLGNVKGIYVHELQSDRLDDIRKLGPAGGSPLKDLPKLESVVEERQKLVREMVELKTANKSPERQKEIIEEVAKLDNRYNLLNTRIQKGTYNLTESFAGMEESPQVIQQLMAKNVISAAVRRGDSFVAFPGAESAQAQLYLRLPNNLKQVIKDLGPGFEYRPITLRNAAGQEMMHPAIVWGKEAAERVQTKGVPFKHGGPVNKHDAFIKAHS